MLSAANRGAWITVYQGGAALCVMGSLDAFLTASGLASLPVTSTLPKLSLSPFTRFTQGHTLHLFLRPIRIPPGVRSGSGDEVLALTREDLSLVS